MLIPVRVPHDAPLHAVGGLRCLSTDHPLWGVACPACGYPLTTDEPITLVYVGAPPEDRKDRGHITGGSVAVHAACAGLQAPDPEAEEPSPAALDQAIREMRAKHMQQCPACKDTKSPNKYLCNGCWFTLQPAARRALNKHDTYATRRLAILHTQLQDGVPLREIQIPTIPEPDPEPTPEPMEGPNQ